MSEASKPAVTEAQAAFPDVVFASPRHQAACIVMAVVAVASFLFFCWSASRWEDDAPHGIRLTCAVLAVLWAIGTPTWFSFERSFWRVEIAKRKINIDKHQDRIRDLWIGLGAIVLVLADHIVLNKK